LLKSVPQDIIKQYCPSLSVKPFSQGNVIYSQGQILDLVYFVLKGQVKLSCVNQDGAEFTKSLMLSGDMFGTPLNESKAFSMPESAVMKGIGKLLSININEFRTLMLNHPPLSLGIIEFLDKSRQKMERRLECFAFKRTESRLIETLRELSGGFDQHCEHGCGQHIQLSQQELADLVGASRSVVSTILNRLRTDGLLGYNREYVCVRDIDTVERMLDL